MARSVRTGVELLLYETNDSTTVQYDLIVHVPLFHAKMHLKNVFPISSISVNTVELQKF